MTWFCGGHWSPSRQLRWGVHVFEELVLGRPFWMLGMGVGVSQFAAVEAEAQRGAGKDLGVSAAARQLPMADSVCPLSCVTTVLPHHHRPHRR